MDWSKVDAALAGALAGAGEARLTVFVHVDPEAADYSVLARLGVGECGRPPGGVLTAEVSPDEVAALTDHPWVHRLRLSHRLRPLDGA